MIMLTNLELYGTDNVPPVPKKVANDRIALLQMHLKVETDKPPLEQKNYTQVKIIEAIRFWRKLSNQEDTGV